MTDCACQVSQQNPYLRREVPRGAPPAVDYTLLGNSHRAVAATGYGPLLLRHDYSGMDSA